MGKTHRYEPIKIHKEDIPSRRNLIAVDAFLNRKAGAHKDKNEKRAKDKLRKEMWDY